MQRLTRTAWLWIGLGWLAWVVIGCSSAATPAPPEAPAAVEEAPAGEAVAPAGDVEWGYTGATGPDGWDEISPAFALCGTGTAQTPIDLANLQPDPDLPALAFAYQPTPLTVLNNGHTIEVEYEAGSSISVGGDTYEVRQFHFHAPSEHTLDGTPYAIELHIVHANEAGNLAVVGVMLEESDTPAPLLSDIWAVMPQEEGTTEAEGEVNVADLLPDDLSYATYSGSLTTPPCSEAVRWLVLTTPVQISTEQADQFRAVYNGNNRPLQELNGRVIRTTAP